MIRYCFSKGALQPLFFVIFLLASTPSLALEMLHFDEMYAGASSQGIVLSEKLKSLDGKEVLMEGFMAPPLKINSKFFVLTRVPMSMCPFCSSDADWPYDIVVVYLEKSVIGLPFDRPIKVRGSLELGSSIDEESGFVSLVRIRATHLEEIK